MAAQKTFRSLREVVQEYLGDETVAGLTDARLEQLLSERPRLAGTPAERLQEVKEEIAESDSQPA